MLLVLVGCKQATPTEFSTVALADKVITFQEDEITISAMLEKYKGKTIFIDVWASWCKDCLQALPKVKKLQQDFKDVPFVFISIDKSIASWKSGIKKYNVTGEHYFLTSDRDGDFGSFIDLDWIPRYMIIDEKGKIIMFKSVQANDKRILEALRN